MYPVIGYSYPYRVDAYDTVEKCGFTPQDWNMGWVPNENFELTTVSKFRKIVKREMTSLTTHFDFKYSKGICFWCNKNVYKSSNYCKEHLEMRKKGE